MTTYQHTTFATLKSLLAARLGDASKVHWTDDELGRTLIETIQIHNALTGSHRDSDTITTSAGVAFYDLTTLLSSKVGFSATDQNAIALIEYELMEAINLVAWSGTEKWTFDTMVRALERRRNQYLTETQTVTTQRSVDTDTTGFVDLPDTVVAVTRAVWRPRSSGRYYQLWPSDETVFQGVLPYWLQTPGIPSSFSIAATPNLRMQLFPPPSELGTVELLTTESGAALDPTSGASGTMLGIPNDVAWGIRFGAMADMLRQDGPARDTARAELCEQLYELSVDLGRSLPVVLTTTINGVQVAPSSLAVIDGTTPGWQGMNRGTPTKVAAAGGNLLTVAPVPDGVYSIGLQFVRNAVVPSSSSDNTAYVQVSRDDIDAILAWAEMLCLIKSQGTQLEHARLGSKLLLDRAAAYNERRVLQSTYLAQMLERSVEERIDRPLYHDTQRSSNRGGLDDRRATMIESDRANGASSHQSRQRSFLARRRRTLGGR